LKPQREWAAVIPAYNAAASIGGVIRGVAEYISPDRILVVDDGSQDDTTAVVLREEGCVLHRRNSNGGKGSALRDAFRIIREWNPIWILCLDADGQHNPAEIPAFFACAEAGDYDLIIGNRRGNLRTMPLSRRFSNIVSSRLLSLRTGRRLPDVQCGFRAIRAEALWNLQLQAERYDIEAEMILQACRKGWKIGWVPISAVYQGERSFIRKLPETLRFLRILFRPIHESHHGG
jgi:glycosyltransferase involved in cell wall biosynthesis